MDENQFGSRRRTYTIGAVFIILFAVLAIRLIDLQFFRYDAFRAQAQKNSIRKIQRDPMRGLIYDREMNVIVDNDPSYTLIITPYEFSWSALPLLKQLFDVDTSEVRFRIFQTGAHSFEPVKIARDLPFEALSRLEENRSQLPGLDYVIEGRRSYKMKPHLAHLLGYTKEISPKLLIRLGDYYQPGDIVGHNGIEGFYENVLRGKKGYGFFTVNAYGRVVESFEQGQADISASEGSDLVLSLDMKLQEYVETLFRKRRGAAVAIDPNNGEILAYASSPDYDLRDMSGRISSDTWNRINTDPALPLYNRCSMAAYPPGSIFKMMLATAALQEGIINESTTINCPGSYTLAGQTFKCHGAHGNINVVHAIEMSCNVFFYKLIFKLGFNTWSTYGSMFHFGRKTGIDVSNESPGILPSEEYYNRRYGKRWNKGYLVSLGIGQGEVNTTPLQMAAYTSTIANGGRYYRPHVVKALVDRAGGGRKEIPLDFEQLPVSANVWKIVQAGMYRVVNGAGTGSAARVGGIRIAGKTGTAQNPHGSDHAWFVGYAPFNSPRIAVAVIVENGGYGGAAAAPVVGNIIGHYLQTSPTPKRSRDSISTYTEPLDRTPKTLKTIVD